MLNPVATKRKHATPAELARGVVGGPGRPASRAPSPASAIGVERRRPVPVRVADFEFQRQIESDPD